MEAEDAGLLLCELSIKSSFCANKNISQPDEATFQVSSECAHK